MTTVKENLSSGESLVSATADTSKGQGDDQCQGVNTLDVQDEKKKGSGNKEEKSSGEAKNDDETKEGKGRGEKDAHEGKEEPEEKMQLRKEEETSSSEGKKDEKRNEGGDRASEEGGGDDDAVGGNEGERSSGGADDGDETKGGEVKGKGDTHDGKGGTEKKIQLSGGEETSSGEGKEDDGRDDAKGQGRDGPGDSGDQTDIGEGGDNSRGGDGAGSEGGGGDSLDDKEDDDGSQEKHSTASSTSDSNNESDKKTEESKGKGIKKDKKKKKNEKAEKRTKKQKKRKNSKKNDKKRKRGKRDNDDKSSKERKRQKKLNDNKLYDSTSVPDKIHLNSQIAIPNTPLTTLTHYDEKSEYDSSSFQIQKIGCDTSYLTLFACVHMNDLGVYTLLSPFRIIQKQNFSKEIVVIILEAVPLNVFDCNATNSYAKLDLVSDGTCFYMGKKKTKYFMPVQTNTIRRIATFFQADFSTEKSTEENFISLLEKLEKLEISTLVSTCQQLSKGEKTSEKGRECQVFDKMLSDGSVSSLLYCNLVMQCIWGIVYLPYKGIEEFSKIVKKDIQSTNDHEKKNKLFIDYQSVTTTTSTLFKSSKSNITFSFIIPEQTNIQETVNFLVKEWTEKATQFKKDCKAFNDIIK
jgi:hypothetical protein